MKLHELTYAEYRQLLNNMPEGCSIQDPEDVPFIDPPQWAETLIKTWRKEKQQ